MVCLYQSISGAPQHSRRPCVPARPEIQAAKLFKRQPCHPPRCDIHLDHGIIGIDSNTAGRAMRFVALGRKIYLFAGSQTGG